MKILVELKNKIQGKQESDGLILALKDFSVQSTVTYTKEEIKDIVESYPDKEIFISINKNIFNKEIEPLKEVLLYLDKLNIKGIFFYDLAILELKKELNLKTDLVWNQTYMVNNYKTCNYYYSKGVKYALLSKEITLEEILEIVNKSQINTMVEVLSLPSVAFSKRKLITNYYKDLNKDSKEELTITEKTTNQEYKVTEDETGTNFFLNTITNGTSIIKDLFNANVPYIIMRETGIERNLFTELVEDTKEYIKGNCQNNDYIIKYQKLGDNTNFFFKKTIYRVKKNG